MSDRIRINKPDVLTVHYEIIETNSESLLRFSVPGLKHSDIKVWTSGILLNVESLTPDTNEDNRMDGVSLTPAFSLSFTLDTSAKIGSPYISRGILTIPVVFDPVILTKTRNYSVRELTTSEENNIGTGTNSWIFKDAHK